MEPIESAFPSGGYALLTVPQILFPWWLYRQGRVSLLALRVWFALIEMRHRRSFGDHPEADRVGRRELLGLLGGQGVRRAESGLRQLRQAGLWAGFGSLPADGPAQDDPAAAGFQDVLAMVPNCRRRVPVPRRILRWLAGGASRVEHACVLGHLLRCAYLRGKVVAPVGNCSSGWIEQVFGVSRARVKHARHRLCQLGMFESVAQPNWHRTRYGQRVAIRMDWTGSGTDSTPGSSPDRYRFDTPRSNQDLPPEGNRNQYPGGRAPAPPAGASRPTPEPEDPRPPDLRHVVPQDLRDTNRLVALHEQAVRYACVPAGERGRIEFVALAEHAVSYATRNPCGMFAWLVRNYATTAKRFITQDDEDRARSRLRPREARPAQPQAAPVRVADLVHRVLGLARNPSPST